LDAAACSTGQGGGMSKTPDEMADEYLSKHFNDEQTAVSVMIFAPIYREVFLDGYKAAKDEYKVAIDTYNDVAKQMLEEAVRIMSPQDQLADADKVMNSSNNSNGWISVKERLPEEGQDCIFYVDFIDKWDKGSERINFQEIGVFNGKDRFDHRSHTDLDRVTYWMLLPKSPEEA
jgi:hypothetical protein